MILYYKPTCPYCKRVTSYMKQNELEVIEMRNTSDPKMRAELVEIGGKGMVPCLVIDGEAMYESKDIIDWMRQNAEIMRRKTHEG